MSEEEGEEEEEYHTNTAENSKWKPNKIETSV